MRVTTAFDRLLALPGASVTDVSFTADGVVVEVALRRRRVACSSAARWSGQSTTALCGAGAHLDLAGQRLFLEYALRRIRCPDCGVRVEAVPFDHPRARHTRDSRTSRPSSPAAGRDADRFAASDRLGHGGRDRRARRLRPPRRATAVRLVQIGVDEVSFRRGQRYLTCVADHSSGSIVWLRTGRNAATCRFTGSALRSSSGC